MTIVDVTYESFHAFTMNKNIVFFGAGRIFEKFCELFCNSGLEEKIECILDNDLKKNGKTKMVNGYNIPIVSVSDFIESDHDDFCLVISCNDLPAVINQMKEIPVFNKTSACIATFICQDEHNIKEKNRILPENFRLTKEQRIPKVLHYCWFGKKSMPDRYKEWMSSWKIFCPDYEIVEWNESNYDITKNEFMYEAYNSGKWGYVSDYARLDIVYNHGGIYLDTDVELIKNLDELLYQKGFMGVDASYLVSLGLGFGAEEKHPLLLKLMEYYNDKHFDSENMVPSPTATKSVYSELGYIFDGSYQIIDDMTFYPEKVLSAKNGTTGLIEPIEQSYAVHHYDGSWADEYRNYKKNYHNDLYSKLKKMKNFIIECEK